MGAAAFRDGRSILTRDVAIAASGRVVMDAPCKIQAETPAKAPNSNGRRFEDK